jgi:predicted ATP-grasp superfamily ATP-dependent carboligase
MSWHRAAFVGDAPRPGAPPDAPGQCVGKAVLFARDDLTFPADGPWADALTKPPPDAPAFADIPHPGTRIKAARPVLTFFAYAETADACLDALRDAAAELDRRLFGGR